MSAYYNEIDPYAAQWLRNLIAADHIAPGDVDTRSIVDVQPEDLRGYDQCHFFAGIGGWSYALRLAGWPDNRPVWTGSCPCQPFSAAGQQRGSDDERHLWPAFFRLIRECRPGGVFGEQVAGAAGLAWLDHVCADLEGAGYAAAAADLPACSVGAPHRRQRLFWVADDDSAGLFFGQRYRESKEPEQSAPQRDDLDRCRKIRWVADAERDDGRAVESQRGSQGRVIDRGIGARVGASVNDGRECMGNADDAGSQGRNRPGNMELRGGEEPLRSTAAAGSLDPWADLEWLYCTDGKARPTQPGIFPLVDGLPEGLVRGGDRSLAPDADRSAEARVMRLRAYGNAIVPQVAAAFIAACRD